MGPNEVLDKGFKFATPVDQFHAVVLTDVEEVSLATGAGEAILGIAQEQVDEEPAGYLRVANVRPLGISRAVAGAALTLFQPCAVANDGRVVAAVAGDVAVGYCLTPVDTAGAHIDLFLTPTANAPSA